MSVSRGFALAVVWAMLVPIAAAQAVIDPGSELASRIGGDVPQIVRRANAARGELVAYQPNADERRIVAAALEKLTPLQRSIAKDRLLSITFAEGLVSNASTARIATPDGGEAFGIVLNPILLTETASQFLTRKEQSVFDTAGSSLRVSIDAGQMTAIDLILLHEATHMVDMTLGLTPMGFYADNAIPEADHTDFTRGVWLKRNRLVDRFHDPIFEDVSFFTNTPPIPVAQAEKLYEALMRTPAVSIYGARSHGEDLADLVAMREFTARFGQPYRIEIRDGDRLVRVFEPAKSLLAQARFAKLAMFDNLPAD